jgi:hypothetical protein
VAWLKQWIVFLQTGLVVGIAHPTNLQTIPFDSVFGNSVLAALFLAINF